VSREIVLVRHGRSAHVETEWIDVDGVRRWMRDYDAAEIALEQVPPPELVALVASSARLLTSDLPRAVASATLLAAGREIVHVPLLRETALETSDSPLRRLGGVRLPLRGWALVFGARWLAAWARGAPPPGVDAAALARAESAADWLIAQAIEGDGRIVAVTHATIRLLVAQTLVRRGWRELGKRQLREWSAWRFVLSAA
jgi:broad specificity phosphatase PhoE